jgi:hypothetical protein
MPALEVLSKVELLLANQKTILENQALILKGQEEILAGQRHCMYRDAVEGEVSRATKTFLAPHN